MYYNFFLRIFSYGFCPFRFVVFLLHYFDKLVKTDVHVAQNNSFSVALHMPFSSNSRTTAVASICLWQAPCQESCDFISSSTYQVKLVVIIQVKHLEIENQNSQVSCSKSVMDLEFKGLVFNCDAKQYSRILVNNRWYLVCMNDITVPF